MCSVKKADRNATLEYTGVEPRQTVEYELGQYISKSVQCEVKALECEAKQCTGVESRQTTGATVGLDTSNQPFPSYHDLDHNDVENNQDDDNTPDLVPILG